MAALSPRPSARLRSTKYWAALNCLGKLSSSIGLPYFNHLLGKIPENGFAMPLNNGMMEGWNHRFQAIPSA
jgi:hypothetical protein